MADQSGYANTRRVKDCREDAVKDRDAEKVGERAARSPLMAWFRVSSAACQDLLQELKNPYYVGDQPTASARPAVMLCDHARVLARSDRPEPCRALEPQPAQKEPSKGAHRKSRGDGDQTYRCPSIGRHRALALSKPASPITFSFDASATDHA